MLRARAFVHLCCFPDGWVSLWFHTSTPVQIDSWKKITFPNRFRHVQMLHCGAGRSSQTRSRSSGSGAVMLCLLLHTDIVLSLFLFITHYTRLARSKVWGSGRLSSRPEALASPATTHSTCNVSCRRRARLRTFSSAFGLKGTTLSLIGRQPTFIRNRATLRIAFGESWDVLQHEGQTVSMTDATHTGRSVTWHYKSFFFFKCWILTIFFPLQVHQCTGRR